MKILSFTWEHGNDFCAVMVCEHCGHGWNNLTGYHDRRYHTQVIPAMHCLMCGKNRAGKTEPKEAA